MFDIMKFGRALSNLRKNADMTQNEVADRLNLSRQAISKYERGESFPDISVLVLIAELFHVTLDDLIGYGEPTEGESAILKGAAKGSRDIVAENIEDVVNLAPLLKPSLLTKLSGKFKEQGMDISSLLILAEYLNDDTVSELMENTSFDIFTVDVLEKFIPFLNKQSLETILERVMNGEADWHLLEPLSPYIDHSVIEAAVIEGVIPDEALNHLRTL